MQCNIDRAVLFAEAGADMIHLGDDIGTQHGPMMSMELWRACRLVVDTGLHAQGWSREKATSYLTANTASNESANLKAIERYMVMPGQATAYKIGMLKILELREKARASLGDKFDIRAFHEVVLSNGAVPLNVLEDLVNDWVSATQG